MTRRPKEAEPKVRPLKCVTTCVSVCVRALPVIPQHEYARARATRTVLFSNLDGKQSCNDCRTPPPPPPSLLPPAMKCACSVRPVIEQPMALLARGLAVRWRWNSGRVPALARLVLAWVYRHSAVPLAVAV